MKILLRRKKTKSQKLREKRRKKILLNQTNQNVEISSSEKCHGVAEPGCYVSSKGERVLNDTVKENSHNGTKKRKRNTKMKGGSKTELEPMDQEYVDLDISKNGIICTRADAGLGVDVESPKIDKVLNNIDKEKSPLLGKRERRRKRFNSKIMSRNKEGQMICDQENKCLEISIDKKSCISAAESGMKDVALTVGPLLQESAEVFEVSTKNVKEGKRKRKRKGKSKSRNEDAKVMLDEGDNCLKISVDSKSCIATAELPINGVDAVEPLLQEPLAVDGISTEIATVGPLLQESAEVFEVSTKNVKEGKRKRRGKSKSRNEDAKVMLDEGDNCLKISVESKSCIATAELPINGVDAVEPLLQEPLVVDGISTEIVKERKTSVGKKKGGKKLKARDKDGDTILDKASKGVDLTVKLLHQESLEIEHVITDIVQKQMTPEEKQGKKIKSYHRDNNVKVIPCEGESLKISDDRKSCIEASEMANKDINLNVELLLQDHAVVDNALTETVKDKKSPKGKQRQKTKLKTSNKNIVEDSNGESLLQDSAVADKASTEIVNEKKSAKGKKTKLNSRNKNKVVPIIDQQDELLVTSINGKCFKETEMGTLQDVNSLLCEQDKYLEISADKKGSIAASVLAIKDVDSNVESLLQDSAVADKAPTEIVNEKKSEEGKKTMLKTKNKKKVEVPIIDQQDELLVTSIDGKCCTETEMGTLKVVGSRSEFPSDKVSSLVISGKVDLPNDLYQLPQRAVTTSQKILLILDINGLLADIVMPPPKDKKSDINMLNRAIFKRPYCDDFLNFCFDTFDVGIWSSRTKRVIDKVVDYLLGERRQKLLFCWDLSHTTTSNFRTLENIHKPLVCKGLSNLWEKRDPSLPWEKGYYTESNTLLIDDSPYKALLNPMHSAIFPHSYTYKDLDDNSLGPGGQLRVYLQDLAKTDNVRRYVEEHPLGQSAITEKSPSWNFYSKVLNDLLNSN